MRSDLFLCMECIRNYALKRQDFIRDANLVHNGTSYCLACFVENTPYGDLMTIKSSSEREEERSPSYALFRKEGKYVSPDHDQEIDQDH